jgi:hypothetical protein
MKEIKGDIWEVKGHFRCITTNGVTKRNGDAVMGRGIAKQASDRNPGLSRQIGSSLRIWGNHCRIIQPTWFVTFPTKHHWREKADLTLIERSARELEVIATEYSDYIFLLPRPGCGAGQLKWVDVKSVIDFLPDNITIIVKSTL